MTLKLGMKEWRPEAIKLKFSDFINRSELPKVPATYGHVKTNDVPWGMLGNDQYGDCVLAGACHEIMTWALATHHQLPSFNTQTIVSQYLNLAGGKDDGLDPISTAKWRVTTGIEDDGGSFHKVKAFASVNRDHDLDVAAHTFGVCGCGFYLPESAQTEFVSGKPWADTSGKPVGGHYVPLVGRNSKGLRFVVTWGRLQAVTEAFWKKYFIGAVAYFSLEYMEASGFSPEGVKEAELDAALAALA
jgi:hypothetical protein